MPMLKRSILEDAAQKIAPRIRQVVNTTGSFDEDQMRLVLKNAFRAKEIAHQIESSRHLQIINDFLCNQ